MTNSSTTEQARAIVEDWHNGYRYLARFSDNGQCAEDLIEAIASALSTARDEALEAAANYREQLKAVEALVRELQTKLDKCRASFTNARDEQREVDARVADGWARSPSCSEEHTDNPCCHVRTGAGIAAAIRANRETK